MGKGIGVGLVCRECGEDVGRLIVSYGNGICNVQQYMVLLQHSCSWSCVVFVVGIYRILLAMSVLYFIREKEEKYCIVEYEAQEIWLSCCHICSSLCCH